MPLTSCGPRIGAERTGVLIRGLLPLSACAQQGLVLRGDVLLELDGQPIADDGTFAVGQQERLSFQHLIHLKFAGELVRLRLLREGTEVEVEVPVYPQARLVPSHIYDSPQQYFIYGGLAFVALPEPYLQASWPAPFTPSPAPPSSSSSSNPPYHRRRRPLAPPPPPPPPHHDSSTTLAHPRPVLPGVGRRVGRRRAARARAHCDVGHLAATGRAASHPLAHLPVEAVCRCKARTPDWQRERRSCDSSVRAPSWDSTAGYSAMTDRRCLSVNGEPVLNLKQMYALVQRLHRSAPYLDFELQCTGGNVGVAVESATADALRDEILTTYRIPSAASQGLCLEE